ncbi:hypothetical protein Dimus_002016 [Dionaea muscipula]
MGFFVSYLLVSIVHQVSNGKWLTSNLNQGSLEYLYWMLAVLGMLNFSVFIVLAMKHIEYKGFDGGTLGDGDFDGNFDGGSPGDGGFDGVASTTAEVLVLISHCDGRAGAFSGGVASGGATNLVLMMVVERRQI